MSKVLEFFSPSLKEELEAGFIKIHHFFRWNFLWELRGDLGDKNPGWGGGDGEMGMRGVSLRCLVLGLWILGARLLLRLPRRRSGGKV